MRTSSFTAIAALMAVGLSSGCQEPPSYRLRWALDGRPLSVTSQCSEAGVFDVRVRTIDVLGRVVDQRSFPCFGERFPDPDALVPGPSLPGGDYAVEVRGVTRNAAPWTDEAELTQQILQAELDGANYEAEQQFQQCRPPLPPGAPGRPKASNVYACRPEELVCDCAPLTVAEGTTPVLDGFDMTAPPQCIDGLDNDGDGLVDRQDPACRGGALDNDEDAQIADASFNVQLSFMSGNANATCSAMAQATPLSRVVVELDDEQIVESPCFADTVRFLRPIAPGEHTVRVSLVSSDGELVATPDETVVVVVERVGGAFDIVADFASEDFFAPIDGLAAFTLSYRGSDDQSVRGCAPGDAENGLLTIETVRLRVLDGHGGPVPTVRLDDGTPLDGVVDIGCPDGTLFTESLTWGNYVITAEALSAAGEVCFSSVGGGTTAAPYESFTVRPPRVLPVPDSCRDCDQDDDCGTFVCDEGLCIEGCANDFQCDDGEACDERHCVPLPG